MADSSLKRGPDSSTHPGPQARHMAALAFTITIWGLTPVMVRSLSLALGPYDNLVIRLVTLGIIFAAILAFTTRFAMAGRDLAFLAAISLFGVLGYYAFSVFGFAYAPAGIGTLIMSTQPMLIAILAWAVGADRLTAATIIGLVVSFAGSVLLVWGNDGGTSASTKDLAFGCALIFIAGVAWAVYVVFSKRIIVKYGALKTTGLSNIIIALPAVPFLRADMLHSLLSMPMAGKLSFLAINTLGTASVITWAVAAGRFQPTVIGSALYVVPVLAVFSGWLFLSEPVTLRIIIAAIIILAGVALSQMRPRRKPQDSAA